MNERILKLAASHFPRDGEGNICATPEIIAEFAELIVRECADIADLNDCGSSDEWDKCARGISRDIKLTFGVEK